MSEIEHIAKRVEADRARLAGTLDDLTETVKPQRLADDLTAAAHDIGGDLAQKAWSTLRENPAGGLLVTLGLGLLASGSAQRPAPATRQQPTAVDPDAAQVDFDTRVAAADAEMRANLSAETEPRPQASKLKAALHVGLDHLPVGARKRVIEARNAAIVAQESVERNARRATRETKGFVHQQPLTVGALAVGFGILAGALLPGTRREDEMLGKRRDALMADARRALEEEVLKAAEHTEAVLHRKTGTTG